MVSTISDHIKLEDAQSWLLSYLKSTEPSGKDPFRSRYLNKLGIDEKNQRQDSSASSWDHGRAKTMDPKVFPSARSNKGFDESLHLQILTRSDDEVRKNYLAKLKNNKILSEQPSKKHQTSIHSQKLNF